MSFTIVSPKKEDKEKFDFIKGKIKSETGKYVSNSKTLSVLLNTYIGVDPKINKIPKKKEIKIKW